MARLQAEMYFVSRSIIYVCIFMMFLFVMLVDEEERKFKNGSAVGKCFCFGSGQ